MENHDTFMHAALDEAKTALESREFPVGCVMVHDGKIVAKGQRINSKGPNQNEMDHAEMVALKNLFKEHSELDRSKIIVYSTMEPCLMCYGTLLLNGIRKIVYAYEDVMGGGTGIDLKLLAPLYREMEVTIIPHVLRWESLELFKIFFLDRDNIYWQDSPLARYTLSLTASDANE